MMRRLTCLLKGHNWTEMRERSEMDFFRECKRCGKFWKLWPWKEDLPLPPPAPPMKAEWECLKCDKVIPEFSSQESARRFVFSGMCQQCQDKEGA